MAKYIGEFAGYLVIIAALCVIGYLLFSAMHLFFGAFADLAQCLNGGGC